MNESTKMIYKKNKHKSQNKKTRNLLSKQNIKKSNKILTIEMRKFLRYSQLLYEFAMFAEFLPPCINLPWAKA